MTSISEGTPFIFIEAVKLSIVNYYCNKSDIVIKIALKLLELINVALKFWYSVFLVHSKNFYYSVKYIVHEY